MFSPRAGVLDPCALRPVDAIHPLIPRTVNLPDSPTGSHRCVRTYHESYGCAFWMPLWRMPQLSTGAPRPAHLVQRDQAVCVRDGTLMQSVDGAVAVITGSGSGIGRATAVALAKR